VSDCASEDDDDDDGGGATGDEVDDDANYGDGTERRNNQIEATAAAGGNWLEGRAEARRASHECRAKTII
jgi:hypothetical protein